MFKKNPVNYMVHTEHSQSQTIYGAVKKLDCPTVGSPVLVCISWKPGGIPEPGILLAKRTGKNGKRCQNWSEYH